MEHVDMPSNTRFSKKTIDFLKQSSEQTSPDWLDKNKKEHEDVLVAPLRALAERLIEEVSILPDARGFKFPKRGFGRLRRPKHKIHPGQPAYRGWVHLQSSRPSNSMFDDNPGLYFFLSAERVFAGGGLYDATSRQVRQIRAWLAEGPKDLKKLFKSKPFATEFPNNFETDKILKTFPRSYPNDHKHIDWLRLQAYYVKTEYTKRELYSADFADLVIENWKQAVKLDTLLSGALAADLWSPTQTSEAVEDDESADSPELWDDRL